MDGPATDPLDDLVVSVLPATPGALLVVTTPGGLSAAQIGHLRDAAQLMVDRYGFSGVVLMEDGMTLSALDDADLARVGLARTGARA